LDCGAKTPVKPPVTAFCPHCDSQRIQISGGKDFRMESIDIDN
jgi:Zn finger protein HypA/HybF involved in hydrogenase expression